MSGRYEARPSYECRRQISRALREGGRGEGRAMSVPTRGPGVASPSGVRHGGGVEEGQRQVRHLILGIRESLDALERGNTSYALQQGLNAKLAEVAGTLSRMRGELGGMDASRRMVWVRKVEAMEDEATTLRVAFDRWTMRSHRRAQEERERSALYAGGARAAAQEEAERERGETRILMDALAAEARASGSLSQSARGVEDMIGQGAALLQAFGTQNEGMKKAHRKALDIMNSIGVSNSALTVAAKRLRQDQRIVAAVIGVAILAILGLIWYRI